MRVELLPPEEWGKLEAVFEREFINDALPNSQEAQIVVVKEGGEVIGFIVVETLVHLAQVYVSPEHRNNGVGWEMAKHIESRMPVGRSVVTIAQSADGEHMAEAWEFTRIPGQLFRRMK